MAIDNVHTLARLDLKIIEALLDTPSFPERCNYGMA